MPIPPRGEGLLDLVDPEHARRHAFDRGERAVQALLALADVLVEQATGLQTQQREAQLPRHDAGREALAAALHAEEQEAAWRRQTEGLGLLAERVLAPLDPRPEACQTGCARRCLRVQGDELERTSGLEDLALDDGDGVQVVGRERQVVGDGTAHRALGLVHRQPAQAPDQLALVLGREAHLHVDGPRQVVHDPRDHALQLHVVGQGPGHARAQRREVRGDRERRARDDHGAPRAATLVHHVLHGASDGRVVQRGREILQVEDRFVAPAGDRAQGRGRVLGVVQRSAACDRQALPQGPAVVGEADRHRRPAHDIPDASLFRRFDEQQRAACAQQELDLVEGLAGHGVNLRAYGVR